jgi:uncharacterized membrane protein YqjE
MSYDIYSVEIKCRHIGVVLKTMTSLSFDVIESKLRVASIELPENPILISDIHLFISVSLFI